MSEPAVMVQGRRVGVVELEQIRPLVADDRHWSRWRISQELARLWDWRNGVGQLKDTCLPAGRWRPELCCAN